MFSKKLKDAVFSRGKELNRQGLYGTFDTTMRYINLVLAAGLVRTPLTGNMVSWISIVMHLVAAGLLAVGDFWFSIGGCVLLFIAEFGDWLDGTVARYRGETSVFQANYLGRLYHVVTPVFFFAGIGVGIYHMTGNIIYLSLGFLTALLQQVAIYILEIKNSILFFDGEAIVGKDLTTDKISKLFVDTSLKKKLITLFCIPCNYLLIKVLILIFVLVHRLEWFLLFYFAYSLVRAIIFSVAVYLRFKKLESKKQGTGTAS